MNRGKVASYIISSSPALPAGKDCIHPTSSHINTSTAVSLLHILGSGGYLQCTTIIGFVMPLPSVALPQEMRQCCWLDESRMLVELQNKPQ